MITLSDFFTIAQNAVKASPVIDPNKPCLQLQTFRALQFQRGQEIGSDNLGATPNDAETPFFWSRAWHELAYNPNSITFEYPALTVFEVVSSAKEPFATTLQKLYALEISVLDQYKGGEVSLTGCDARPINQIFLDTGALLDSFLQYLKGVVIATTSADPTERVYYEPWLVSEVGGSISSFNVVYRLDNSLSSRNKELRFSRVEYPAQNVYGTKTLIQLPALSCPEYDFTGTIEDYGLQAFEAGKNCC